LAFGFDNLFSISKSGRFRLRIKVEDNIVKARIELKERNGVIEVTEGN